jgi:TPR repeat protein
MSVPIYNLSQANWELEDKCMEDYYACCGKSICKGCTYSFRKSGNIGKCPFCNADIRREGAAGGLIDRVEKRLAANDASAICMLATYHHQGLEGVEQDHARAMELYARSAEAGFCKAYYFLADIYEKRGDSKKAKFHFEAAAMAGDEEARNNLGRLEFNSGKMERAIKHWTIAASAGCFRAMHTLITFFKKGTVSKESIDTTLAAYNGSCAEMQSEARDECILAVTETM